MLALLPLALLSVALVPGDAAEIHASAIVIDTHVDTPRRFLDEGFSFSSVTPASEGQLDLSKAKAGNLGAVFFSIWVDPEEYAGHYPRRTLQLIDAVRSQVENNPKEMVLAQSVDDVLKARASSPRKLAALMGIEGGHAIEEDLGLLRSYYLLGVRYMTLTWSNSVPWADSSGDLDDPKIAHHEGLTPFGRDVVHEMNRLGMMVDISHVSDKTFWDVLATTHVPLIASHSSARAVTPAPRNLTDEMLRAVAKNGGVVMVNFFPGFIDEEYRKAFEALAPTLKTKVDAALEKFPERDPKARAREANRVTLALVAKLPRPPLKALIDHLDHIAKVAGIDHVGLGSDFDGIPSVPLGLDSAADLPHITQALVQRGYNREQIHKLLGGNLLRTFREVERARGKPAH